MMSNTIGLPIQTGYIIKDDTYVKRVKSADRDIELEIGDAKQPGQFQPQLKVKHFNNAANFSVRYDAKTRKGVNAKEGKEKLQYKLGKETIEFFETDNGFEIAITLEEKPASNKFDFTLNSKGVDYYFQPDIESLPSDELAKLPPESYQPEHIKNSYAVYSTVRPPGVSDSEYKSGKIGHIHRVWAEDFNGYRVWCDMSINNDILSITVPQSFLDSAAYPVLIDPDFGYDTAGGTEATISASTKNTADDQASRHHTATSGQQVTNFSFYGRVTIGTGLIEIGAYDMGTGNDPAGATLNSSADVSLSNTSAAWVTSSDVDSALTSGNKYSIAIGDSRPTGGVIKGYYDVLGGDQVAESTATGALDATFNNDDGHLTYIFSAYGTVDAVAGPPTFSGTIPDQVFARTDTISIPTASYFIDPETYSAANLPAFLSINTSTGEITANSANVNGTYTDISVTCSNSQSPPTATSNTFTITVNAQAPIWTGSVNNQSGNVDSAITPLDVSGLVDHEASFSASGLPAGLTIDSGTGVITGTPTTEQDYLGVYITATNPDGSTNSNTFTWSIGAALPIPTISAVNGGNGLQRNQTITITGTNFESPQGTGTVTFNSITLTVSSWADTSIDVGIPIEGFVFDTVSTLEITNDSGYNVQTTDQFKPQPNYSFATLGVNYAQLPTDSFLNSVVGLENLAVGDQVEYETAANPSGTVSVDSNGVATITGVGGAGDYDFDYLINDVSDLTVSSNGTAVVTLQGSGADVTAPSWVSSPSISNVTTVGFDVGATIDETGSIYVVVVPSTEATPTPAQVVAGQNAAGGTPSAAASATSTTSISETITGLSDGTEYKVCFVAQDAAGTPNVQASTTVVNETTTAITDSTPPTFTTGPTVTQVTTITALLNAAINEAGTIFWVIVPGGYSDPSPAEIVSGLVSNPSSEIEPAPYSGSGSPITDYQVTGLAPGTPYKAAFAARDSSNNLQLTSTVINFTTSAAGTTRSVNDQLLDRNSGAAIASTLLDYSIQSAFAGSVTDSGQVTTDGSGNYSITNLNVAAGTAWITFKDAATGLKVATGPVTVTEA